MQDDFEARGISVFDLALPFDEKALLEDNIQLIKSELQLKELSFQQDAEGEILPGKPHITFAKLE